MEKSIAKLEKQSGKDSAKVTQFRQAINNIQKIQRESTRAHGTSTLQQNGFRDSSSDCWSLIEDTS